MVEEAMTSIILRMPYIYSMERITKNGTNVASKFLGVCVSIKFLVCNILLGLEKRKILRIAESQDNQCYGIVSTTDCDYVV